MMELPPHVLRYWETEFTELKPKKNRAGNRIYNQSDLDTIQRIQYLLRKARYTLEGAKMVMARGGDEEDSTIAFKKDVVELRKFLTNLLEKLEDE